MNIEQRISNDEVLVTSSFSIRYSSVRYSNRPLSVCLPYLRAESIVMILPILVVAPSDKRGRGVFASQKIAKGTIIEISPVLVLSVKDRKLVEKTILFDYIFEWGKKRKKACIALGYLSIYNHAYNANCEYEMDYDTKLMSIKAIRDIKKGEELFVNYNAVADDVTPIWFEAK